jgi:DNA modification methylase
MNANKMLSAIDRADRELEQRYTGRLLVNRDLDRSLVSFQANKSENGHRWCKYKEGFSARLIRYIFGEVGIIEGPVLDPFAGAGTTLFIASELGLDSTGIELLPCSTEIIEVRKLASESSRKKLASFLREFSKARSWERGGGRKEFGVLRITEGAYPPATHAAVERYLHDIDLISDRAVGRVLRFALLCILESVSYTRKDGQYLRWDQRSGRRQGTRPFDKGPILNFTEAITAKLAQIAADLTPRGDLFGVPPELGGSITLFRGSCLDVLPKFPSASFSGLVTSPPYCNRYDYTRTYALELALLGTGEDEIRRLRQQMLTCTVENREKEGLQNKFSAEFYRKARSAFESQELLQLVLSYLDQCRNEGSLNNTGIPRMVRNYFLELSLVIAECARTLKPGAPFVMVNDNVRYQGAHVPVDLILSDIAGQVGLELDTIWVLPRGKGNSSQQMGMHGRAELRKCVYLWRRPKANKSTWPAQLTASVRSGSLPASVGQTADG